MKINCEMAQDLLPLYEDGVCSETSKAAVVEHLSECESCRNLLKTIPAIPEAELEMEDAPKAKESFQKVRKRWRASLLTVVLALPMLILCVNQIRGEGICFTNWDDHYVAWKFVKHLEAGEFEQAAKLHDFTELYGRLRKQLLSDVNAYKRDFKKVMAGDEVWYVAKSSYQQVSDKENPENFWVRYLFNDYQGVLFPEQAMVWMAENMPDELERVNKDCYQNSNGIRFIRNKTDWGEYFTAEHFVINIDTVTVVPEAAYLEILPDMEEKAQATYQRIQDQYGAVARMSETEFVAHMEEKYASELETVFSEDWTVTWQGFDGLYRNEGSTWQTEVKVHVTYGTEQMDMGFILMTDRGKLFFSGGMYTDYEEWQHILIEALYAEYSS